MNRRNFIGSLIAIPAITRVFPTLVKGKEIETPKDIYEIFSPDDIRLIWGYDKYVETPVFLHDGRGVCVKMFKLTMKIDHEELIKPGRPWLQEAKYLAKTEITKKLDLTHIYSVRWIESPIIDPSTFKCWHSAIARGSTVK